jgi:hypothetical protein
VNTVASTRVLLALISGLEQVSILLRNDLRECGLSNVRREAKRERRVLLKVTEELQKDSRLSVEQAIDKIKDLAGGKLFVVYLNNIWKRMKSSLA